MVITRTNFIGQIVSVMAILHLRESLVIGYTLTSSKQELNFQIYKSVIPYQVHIWEKLPSYYGRAMLILDQCNTETLVRRWKT